MAGNLVISQINGGQIGFRNILINGWVNTSYEINQRVLTFAGVSDGEYFADRWKRVNSSNMTQIVEEGNYKPGVNYCLSGTGVTTQVLTSPSSGNWTLPNIPSTASYVQLEEGDSPSDFEWRSKGYELSLCQRYFSAETFYSLIVVSNITSMYSSVFFPVEMRIIPTILVIASSNLSGSASGSSHNTNPSLTANSKYSFMLQNTNSGASLGCSWTADAEL
jgi:hypothetical protein